MKAIVLVSGGLDSAVLLASAIDQGRECTALSFRYGQRNAAQEDLAVAALVKHYDVPLIVMPITTPSVSHSSLTNPKLTVPKDRPPESILNSNTPNTYLPARNTIFLAYAMGQAEILNANDIHFGCMGYDIAYPDCRKPYVHAFQELINQAISPDDPERNIQLITPFVVSKKASIITQGLNLNVPIGLTFSCYDPSADGKHCGNCDACFRRRIGFASIGIDDPTDYKSSFSGKIQEP